MGMQALIHLVYPPQCLTCGGLVGSDFALCPACWSDTPFIAGLVCGKCGTPLPGEEAPGEEVLCDDCLRLAPPWAAGRAAMVYGGKGRSLILGLKHGDRMDVAAPAAGWLMRAGAPILQPGMLAAPVPLYRRRLFTRRYNQAALLSHHLSRLADLDHCPDLLQRIRQTNTQDGKSREGRFDNIAGAFRLHPGRADLVRGRDILLVDDVMTSGATLAEATLTCMSGGAASVSVLVLARVTHPE